MHGRILFGLAFNDPDDVEPFFPLDAYDLMPPTKIKYKSNPSQGVDNLGYFEIDTEKIYNGAKQDWDKSLGRLFLFGIDKNKDNFMTPYVNSGHEVFSCSSLPCIEPPLIDSRG